MLRFLPLLLTLGLAWLAWRFSAWQTAKTLDARSVPLADARLKALTDRMARAMGLPGIRVNLYRVAAINGLAAPDGRIYITEGFYDRYRAGEVTPEEMASVIAHELGHVALGHARQRMIDFSGQNALRMALSMVLQRFLPGIGPWLANLAHHGLAAHLSREDEYEADAYAAALLSKAGIGTAPQKRLLAKLDQLAGPGSAGAPAWLMSHPRTGDRIKAIEKLETRWARVDGA